MVISRSDVRYQRTEGVERCVVTVRDLAFHVFFDFMQRYMPRSFNECLYVFVPCSEYKFTHGIQFGKLCLVISVSDTARTKSVTQGYGYIVLCQNITDVIKMLI